MENVTLSANFSALDLPQAQSNETMFCDEEGSYTTAQIIVRVYCYIPVVCLGVVTGAINIAVFAAAPMRSSLINWYLMALSISDVLLLCCSFCMFTFSAVAELGYWFRMLEVATYTMRSMYPIGMIVQTLNIYLTILVSFHRYLGVCHPFKAQRWLTSGQVQGSLLSVTFFCILFNLPRFFEIGIVDCFSETLDRNTVTMAALSLSHNKYYSLLYSVITYSFLMFIFPFTILIVVNSCILRTLYKSKHKRKRMASVRRKRQTVREERKEFSTTVMLLAVVALFLLCNSLAFVSNFIDIAIKHQHEQGKQYSLGFLNAFTVLVEVGNLMVAVNSAASFFVFAAFGTKYRQVLVSWFGRAENELNASDAQIKLLRSYSTANPPSFKTSVAQINNNDIPCSSIDRHSMPNTGMLSCPATPALDGIQLSTLKQ